MTTHSVVKVHLFLSFVHRLLTWNNIQTSEFRVSRGVWHTGSACWPGCALMNATIVHVSARQMLQCLQRDVSLRGPRFVSTSISLYYKLKSYSCDICVLVHEVKEQRLYRSRQKMRNFQALCIPSDVVLKTFVFPAVLLQGVLCCRLILCNRHSVVYIFL